MVTLQIPLFPLSTKCTTSCTVRLRTEVEKINNGNAFIYTFKKELNRKYVSMMKSNCGSNWTYLPATNTAGLFQRIFFYMREETPSHIFFHLSFYACSSSYCAHVGIVIGLMSGMAGSWDKFGVMKILVSTFESIQLWTYSVPVHSIASHVNCAAIAYKQHVHEERALSSAT